MQDRFIPAGAGQVQNVLGMRHVNKLTPEDGGPLMLELTIPPGLGAPPHRHDDDAESFYILSGEITFVTDGETRIARAGDFQHLPVGGVHAFRNDGQTDARALVVATPGIEALRFFTEIDAAMREGRADPPAVTAIAERHGLAILV
jgi:quercetin dioxygenase-like cupin family protein